MMDLLSNALLSHMVPMALLFSALGVSLGLVFGAIPGLNQGVLMALALPLTFYMDSNYAQYLLIGMYVGGVSGAMVTGIVLGIPGSPAAVMTTFDGHALARQGKAAQALALGVTASFIGGMISWLFLATISVPLARVALSFSGFEFSALIIGGLLMIATAGGGDFLRGLISGFLGILVALIGLDPVSTDARFTFGFEALDNGFSILPVLLGIFAIGHLTADVQVKTEVTHQIEVRFRDLVLSSGRALRHWGNLIRSSLIGTWIGILPGIGANIGSVIAYMVTRNLSRDPESFGSGKEEGVVASEAGNNSVIGGALIPMITLGIPGSGADVILMAALIFHNIEPGPLLMIEHADTFYGVIATFFVANILMFVILFSSCIFLGRLSDIPKHIMAPAIFVIAIIGIYSINNLLFDVWVMLCFGVVGLLMRWARIPTAPFVIGFILTPLLEVKVRSSLMMSDGSFLPFITRPVSLGILVFSILFVLWPTLSKRYLQRRNKAVKVRG